MNSTVRVGREYVVPAQEGSARPAEPAALTPGGIIKFHAPEIVFGPDSLAEAGFAAAQDGRPAAVRRHRSRASSRRAGPPS